MNKTKSKLGRRKQVYNFAHIIYRCKSGENGLQDEIPPRKLSRKTRKVRLIANVTSKK